jgi:hypothetical protein
MRFLINAFSPTMLGNVDSSHVVFRTLPILWAESVFRSINTLDGVNALNPRHAALFEALAPWHARPPAAAPMISMSAGDDALIILPREQGRAGAEVQTSAPSDYRFIWCGVFASAEDACVRPEVEVREVACGVLDLSRCADLAPLAPVDVYLGAEWDMGGTTLVHRGPTRVFRGMLR